ncbi:MAG: hypothetical protein GJT30_13035 [Geobacter sp.]|nr:hypothetical protein [Geobacter sp.]
MKRSFWIIGFLLFVAGGAAGFFLARSLGSEAASHRHHTLRQAGYRYTNPLLECEIAQEYIQSGPLGSMKQKVAALIREKVAAGDVQDVAVYFRDLHDGPWFGINEQAEFSPASLMKIPVMIGYLKMAETDPGLLHRRFTFDGGEDWTAMQNIKPSVTIERGKSYTVDDLLFRMMAYSDNNAWHLLFENIDYHYLDRILSEVGVSYDPDKEEDLMTVKSYSSLLRVLYNASYLSKPLSEKALELLAHVEFKDGIVAGIPAGVPVVSKYGERTLGSGNEVKQLHEFGIVYYPNNHYLLGIMTRGNDFARLAGVLSDISRLIYAEVDHNAHTTRN